MGQQITKEDTVLLKFPGETKLQHEYANTLKNNLLLLFLYAKYIQNNLPLLFPYALMPK